MRSDEQEVMRVDNVTLEDLRRYIDLKNELKSIPLEIEALYYPVKSAGMTWDGSTRSTTPGDPTVTSFYKREARREKLEKRQAELMEITDRIEHFVDTMDDRHVAAIIKIHFFAGKSWATTCHELFGYFDKDTCRKTVKRYFEGRKK